MWSSASHVGNIEHLGTLKDLGALEVVKHAEVQRTPNLDQEVGVY